MKLIGNIKPKPLSFYRSHAELPLRLRDGELGEVMSVDIDDKGCVALYQFLRQHGYCLRNSATWAEPAFVAVQGSVPPHEDDRLGLIAFWLLHKQPLSKKRESIKHQWLVDNPWLFTNQQRKRIGVGDVVIFDAGKTHAWMCNGGIYAISQTIYRKRKP